MENKRKIQVLRRRADFLSLQKNGFRARPANWLVLSYQPNGLEHSRIGWTIPKKVGKAVTRNRLKRWCREWTRELPQTFVDKGVDLNIVFIKNDQKLFAHIQFQQLKDVLNRGLRSIAKHF